MEHWKYDPNDRDDLLIKDLGGSLIAEVSDNRKYTLRECQAHAKLIASSPEMIEEIKTNHEFLLNLHNKIQYRTGINWEELAQSLRDRMAKQISIMNKANI